MRRTWFQPFGIRIAAVALLIAVSGCYIPARFDAEIEISRFGTYEMKFEGYMAQIELYNDLRQKKITQAEELDRVQIIKNDFLRDSSTRSFDYFKQGHFKVKWQRSGDILQSKMVTFFRRNENILSIIYVKETGQITIKATPIGPDKAKTIQEMGIGMEGQLRVRTDARVVSQNATRQETPANPKSPAERVYIWDIKSILDPPASMSLFLQ